jgi:hypothetical protein
MAMPMHPGSDGVMKDHPYRDIPVSDFVDWLGSQPDTILWTVDGEDSLSGEVNFLCDSSSLAFILRKRIDQKIRFYTQQYTPKTFSISEYGDWGGDYYHFMISWLSESTHGDHWEIIQDTLAENFMNQIVIEGVMES